MTLNIRVLSNIIMDKVISTDEFQNAASVFCYITFAHELVTSKILNFPGKNIFVPKVCGGEMYMTKYSPQSLKTGAFGSPEPTECNPVTPSDNDVIIVPALACDKNFYRIGYGKGFYDRYLKDYNGFKIGIIYKELNNLDFKSDSYDVYLDLVIEG